MLIARVGIRLVPNLMSLLGECIGSEKTTACWLLKLILKGFVGIMLYGNLTNATEFLQFKLCKEVFFLVF